MILLITNRNTENVFYLSLNGCEAEIQTKMTPFLNFVVNPENLGFHVFVFILKLKKKSFKTPQWMFQATNNFVS
jgi:hypothetical protein